MFFYGFGFGVIGWLNYSCNVVVFLWDFWLLIFDLFGFGWLDMKFVDVRVLGFWVDMIVGLFDVLDLLKVYFVGNFMGGMVMLEIVLE